MLSELPDCDTNDVFGEHVTTAFTGATRIIDAHFVSEISPNITFDNKSRLLYSCFQYTFARSAIYVSADDVLTST